MKSMKRQTRASGNDGEPSDTNERKKVKLINTESLKKDEDGSEEIAKDPNSNGEQQCLLQAEQILSQLSPPKTSTPITHNGSVKNLSEKFHNTSAIPSDTEQHSTPSMEVDGNVLQEQQKEVNGEQTNCEMEMVADVNIENTTEEKKSDEMPAKEINGTEEISFATEAKENNDSCASKCDVDFFLSSLLQVHELEGHADQVSAIAVDEDILISASHDTTIKMWNSHKKTELCNFQGHTGSVNAVLLLSAKQSQLISEKLGFIDVERIVISGATDCSIRLWSIPGGTQLQLIYTFNGITCLGYMENKNYIVVGTDGGKLEVWNVLTSQVLYSIVAHGSGVTDLKVDDAYIYTTSSDGNVKVWLLEDDELFGIYSRSRKVPLPGGEMIPTKWNCVTSHEGEMYLGDNTSDIKLLNWNAGRLRMLKNQTQQNGSMDSVCAKHNMLLSSSYDQAENSGAINVWQLPSMTYICTMSGDVSKINSLDFTTTKDGILRVVSGGEKLLMWDYILAKPAAPGEEDKYFCREVEHLGEETPLKSSEKSVAKKPRVEESKRDEVDAGLVQKSKCTLI